MADRQTEMRISLLSSRKSSIEEQVNMKNEDIVGIQEEIAKLNEQIQKIDEDVAKLRVRAERQAQKEQEALELSAGDADPMGVEESDASTTTGALDASSQSSGGDQVGWRHYKKMGDTVTRHSVEEKKKKKYKKVYEGYVNSLWNIEE